MPRVYVDTEYIYPGMSASSGRPTAQDQREIVQIAAIRVDPSTGSELESFEVFVVPLIVLPVPAFFFELTGIVPKDLTGRGEWFGKALDRLVAFCRSDEIWTFNADREVLQQNCSFHHLPFPFAERPFQRVCAMLGGWGVKNPSAYSSGTLHRAAGLVMEGHVHNALFDVRSMAKAVWVFEQQDLQWP